MEVEREGALEMEKGYALGVGDGVVGRPLTCCEFRQLKPISGVSRVSCAKEFRMRAEVLANSKVVNCQVEAPLSSL